MASINDENTEASQMPLLDPDQHALLMSFGLTERDLHYMGPRQRQLVEEVLGQRVRADAAA